MDIDIDFPSNFTPTDVFPHAVPASMVRRGELVKHPCGHYLQNIPVDSITSLAAIPYEEAEVLGYTKIDFLHLSLLDRIPSKATIRELISKDPDWSMLENAAVVEQLFQIHNHFTTINQIKPACVQELADCIALIRPGKRHLLPHYLIDRKKTRDGELYYQSADGYFFKKSHAISYALTIVLQLHLFNQL